MKRIVLLVCLILLTIKSFAAERDLEYRMACLTMGSDRGEIISIDTKLTFSEDTLSIENVIFEGSKCFEGKIITKAFEVFSIEDVHGDDYTIRSLNLKENHEYSFVKTTNPYTSNIWGKSYDENLDENFCTSNKDQCREVKQNMTSKFKLVHFNGGATIISDSEKIRLFYIE